MRKTLADADTGERELASLLIRVPESSAVRVKGLRPQLLLPASWAPSSSSSSGGTSSRVARSYTLAGDGLAVDEEKESADARNSGVESTGGSFAFARLSGWFLGSRGARELATRLAHQGHKEKLLLAIDVGVELDAPSSAADGSAAAGWSGTRSGSGLRPGSQVLSLSAFATGSARLEYKPSELATKYDVKFVNSCCLLVPPKLVTDQEDAGALGTRSFGTLSLHHMCGGSGGRFGGSPSSSLLATAELYWTLDQTANLTYRFATNVLPNVNVNRVLPPAPEVPRGPKGPTSSSARVRTHAISTTSSTPRRRQTLAPGPALCATGQCSSPSQNQNQNQKSNGQAAGVQSNVRGNGVTLPIAVLIDGSAADHSALNHMFQQQQTARTPLLQWAAWEITLLSCVGAISVLLGVCVVNCFVLKARQRRSTPNGSPAAAAKTGGHSRSLLLGMWHSRKPSGGSVGSGNGRPVRASVERLHRAAGDKEWVWVRPPPNTDPLVSSTHPLNAGCSGAGGSGVGGHQQRSNASAMLPLTQSFMPPSAAVSYRLGGQVTLQRPAGSQLNMLQQHHLTQNALQQQYPIARPLSGDMLSLHSIRSSSCGQQSLTPSNPKLFPILGDLQTPQQTTFTMPSVSINYNNNNKTRSSNATSASNTLKLSAAHLPNASLPHRPKKQPQVKTYAGHECSIRITTNPTLTSDAETERNAQQQQHATSAGEMFAQNEQSLADAAQFLNHMAMMAPPQPPAYLATSNRLPTSALPIRLGVPTASPLIVGSGGGNPLVSPAPSGQYESLLSSANPTPARLQSQADTVDGPHSYLNIMSTANNNNNNNNNLDGDVLGVEMSRWNDYPNPRSSSFLVDPSRYYLPETLSSTLPPVSSDMALYSQQMSAIQHPHEQNDVPIAGLFSGGPNAASIAAALNGGAANASIAAINAAAASGAPVTSEELNLLSTMYRAAYSRLQRMRSDRPEQLPTSPWNPALGYPPGITAAQLPDTNNGGGEPANLPAPDEVLAYFAGMKETEA